MSLASCSTEKQTDVSEIMTHNTMNYQTKTVTEKRIDDSPLVGKICPILELYQIIQQSSA